MKIGITCYPIYGGSGVVATELGKALAQRGHEIHFISYQMPFRLAAVTDRIYFHEVGVSSYPVFNSHPYTLALCSTMVDVAQYHALDLLHVHYAIPHATSAILARDILAQEGIRLPVVTTLHGTDITIVGQDPSYAPVVTYSINASDGVTCVSNALRQETQEAFGVTRRIEVIPNFVDVGQFSSVSDSSLRARMCPEREKLLVHVSNFRKVKNAGHVVEVFSRLRRRSVAVKLLFVGDGPERAATEHLARELGVQAHVRFLGKQNPVSDILSLCDVFVMPSGFESFGLAALEAMACGVPVVCSDVGGLPELVTGSGGGFLCPLGDIDAFTEAVYRLLTDEGLRVRMAAAARSHAAEQFNVDAVVPLYEGHYDRVRSELSSRVR